MATDWTDPEQVAAAVRRYPLPEGIDDCEMTQGEIAQALNVSDTTIAKYRQKGMPFEEEGGNGRGYSYRLSSCFAWYSEKNDLDREERSKAEAAARQMAMHFANRDEDDPNRGMTAKEIAEHSEADYKANKAAELRGDLVRASRVQQVLEDVLVGFRKSLTVLPDFCEMEFGLSPAQVQALEERCDQVLLNAKTELAKMTAGGSVSAVRKGEQGAFRI